MAVLGFPRRGRTAVAAEKSIARSFAQQVAGGRDVVGDGAVVAVAEGDPRANAGVELPEGSGRDAGGEVAGLGGAESFDGDDVLDVGDDLAEVAGGGGAHGVDVFDAGGGRDGVDAGGVGEDPVLGDKGGGEVVGNHVAGVEAGFGDEAGREAAALAVDEEVDPALGDDPQRGDGDLGGVGGEGEGVAVEVAAGEDGVVLARLGEDQRVVGGGVDLDVRVSRSGLRASTDGPWIWGTQRSEVGVLDAGGGRRRLRTPRSRQRMVGGDGTLAGVGPGRVDPVVERGVARGEGDRGRGRRRRSRIGPGARRRAGRGRRGRR